jgi:hypothetical protein
MRNFIFILLTFALFSCNNDKLKSSPMRDTVFFTNKEMNDLFVDLPIINTIDEVNLKSTRPFRKENYMKAFNSNRIDIHQRANEPLVCYLDPSKLFYRYSGNWELDSVFIGSIILASNNYCIVHYNIFMDNKMGKDHYQYQAADQDFFCTYDRSGKLIDFLLVRCKEYDYGGTLTIVPEISNDGIKLNYTFDKFESSLADPLQDYSISGTGSSIYKIENGKFIIETFTDNTYKNEIDNSESEPIYEEPQQLFKDTSDVSFELSPTSKIDFRTFQNISSTLCQHFQRSSPSDFIAQPYPDLAGGLIIANSQKLKGFYLTEFAEMIQQCKQSAPALYEMGTSVITEVETGNYQEAYAHTLTWMKEVSQEFYIDSKGKANNGFLAESVTVFG